MTAPDTRSERISAEILEEILRGRHAVGARLASERELAARFSASRGAAREALHRLANLGIIDVQPGGARVQPIEDSTLEILGPLLDLTEPPDAELVDQILAVMSALIGLAARTAVERASESEIEAIRALIGRIRRTDIGETERFNCRIELGRLFMAASGNLPLQLIANSLRLQFGSRFERPGPGPEVNREYVELMDALDRAVANRDANGVHSAMQTIFELNRRAAAAALEAAAEAEQRGTSLRATGG